MGRVFVTGDKHGDFVSHDDYPKIEKFCQRFETTKEDYMVILGDHGVSYHGPAKDKKARQRLESMPISFILIRGNHDYRPTTKQHTITHISNNTVEGDFFIDKNCPSLLFAKEFGWYEMAGNSVFVIGGAASADKNFRLYQNELGNKAWRWFPDEQLTRNEMQKAAEMFRSGLCERGEPVIVMSHTCPLDHMPHEMMIDRNMMDEIFIDNAMEIFMNEIDRTKINAIVSPGVSKIVPACEKWFCGHFHTDKVMDRMRFMYHDIVELQEPLYQTCNNNE